MKIAGILSILILLSVYVLTGQEGADIADEELDLIFEELDFGDGDQPRPDKPAAETPGPGETEEVEGELDFEGLEEAVPAPADKLEFGEVDLNDLDFIDEIEFEETGVTDEFRAETATYGFLLNYANEKLNIFESGADEPMFDFMVDTFNQKGYYDFSSLKEDDFVKREVFAQFIFSVIQKRKGLDEILYPDKEEWAVANGFLPPRAGEATDLDLSDLDLTGESSKEDDLFPEDEPEVPPFIHPNRVAGAVDVESTVTLKFVAPPSGVKKFRILKKNDLTGAYEPVGQVGDEDMSFTDTKSLASFRKGREIVQYQVARTDEDFIITITYMEASGITVDKKILYQIVPDKDSIEKKEEPLEKKGEASVLPEFLSANVDFTGNISLRWVEEAEDHGSYKIMWRQGDSGAFSMVGEDVEATEFADSLSRAGLDIAAVNEYQISRTMDDFSISISYDDSQGQLKEAKFVYQIVRDVVPTSSVPFRAEDYLTRGEVIDAFEMLEDEIPKLRKKLVDLPVFSPVYILPASPI